MSSIDKRTVQMEFDNSQFEKGAAATTSTLDRLKAALKFQNGSKGLEDISKAANNVNLSGIENGVNSLSSRFSSLGVIGMTVLQNLTNTAVNFGKKLVSSITQPLIQGGINRALNLEQAQFQLEGLHKDWNTFKDDILYGVKDTAYGMDEAAKVASQLAASGYDAGDSMKKYLRSISGVAAMTGSSYSDIGDIFTTVAGNGRLMGEQLLQLSGRGINAAAAIVKYFKEVRGQSNITESEVRDMVSKGKIDFDTFASAMDYAYGAHAKEANKTFVGSLANVKAALARIGADVATQQLHNLRDIFNALIPVIDRIHEILMPVIGVINKATTATAQLIVKLLNILVTSKSIKGVTEYFGLLSDKSLKTNQTMSNLKDTLQGVVSFFDIFWTILKKVLQAIFPAAKGLGSVAEVILAITGALGRFITFIDQCVKNSVVLSGVLGGVKLIFTGLSKVISFVAGGISSLISSLGQTGDSVKKTTKSFNPLSKILEICNTLFEKLKGILEKISPLLSAIADRVKVAFGRFDDGLVALTTSGGLDNFFQVFGVGFLSAFLIILNKITDGFLKFSQSALFTVKHLMKYYAELGPMFDEIKGALIGLQHDLNADALMRLAKAIALLTVSLLLLSFIPTDKLFAALTAIGTMTGILVVVTKVFSGMASSMSFKDLAKSLVYTYGMADALKNLAKALLIMSVAVKILSTMSWSEMIKGLSSIGILLVMMSKSVKVFSQNSKGLWSTAAGLIILGTALNVMAGALKKLADIKCTSLIKSLGALGAVLLELKLFMYKSDFSSMGIKSATGILILAAALRVLSDALVTISGIQATSLVKALAGLTGILVVVAAFVKIAGGSKSIITTAIGLNILAAAMKVFASVLTVLGQLSLSELEHALGGLGGSLVILAAAMMAMPDNILGTAISLVIVAKAISSLTKSLSTLGGLSMDELGRGLLGLGGSLVILAAAMVAMDESLGGAVAMYVAAKAMSALAKPLMVIAQIPVGSIIKSLVALAAAFAVIGVAALALSPIIVSIMALSVAIALIGGGFAAFGAGLVMISAGITALSVAFTSAGVSIVTFIRTLGSFIGQVAKTLALGVVEFIKAIASNFASIAESILSMIDSLMSSILAHIPSIVETGLKIVIALLEGISENIFQIAAVAVKIVANFINGIASQIGTIIQAGYNLIIAFINGLADGIANNTEPLLAAIGNLITTIITTIGSLLLSGIPNLISLGGSLISGLGSGIQSGASQIWGAFKNAVSTAVSTVISSVGNFISSGAQLISGLASGIRSMASSAINAVSGIPSRCISAISSGISGFVSVGRQVIDGFISGMTSKMSDVVSAAKSLGSAAKNKLKEFLHIHSPSRVFMEIGMYVTLGFAKGISAYASRVADATQTVGSVAVNTMNRVSSKIADAVNDNMDSTPVITPVIDLTNVESGVKQVDSLMGSKTISMSGAASVASSINAGMKSNEFMSSNGTTSEVNNSRVVNYTQNNYSPKSLSRLDIYRQTRNQLSAMKGLIDND